MNIVLSLHRLSFERRCFLQSSTFLSRIHHVIKSKQTATPKRISSVSWLPRVLFAAVFRGINFRPLFRILSGYY